METHPHSSGCAGRRNNPSFPSLFLGAVEIKVSADEPLLPFVEDGALYEPFRRPGPGVTPRKMCSVALERGAMPLPADATILFDASPAWRLYGTADGRRFVTRLDAAPGQPGDNLDPEPLWTAWLAPGLASVQVHCGPALCRPDGLLNPVCYPLDQILLLHLLARADMLLVHGAGIEIDGGVTVFAGVSGAGKTTLSRQFIRAGVGRILTDDRVLIVRTPDGWLAGGTPWPGEGRFARNEWHPLRRISFLRQSDHNAHVSVPPGEALEHLLPVLSIPWFDTAATTALCSLAGQLLTSIPSTLFSFTADPRAADPALHRFTRQPGPAP